MDRFELTKILDISEEWIFKYMKKYTDKSYFIVFEDTMKTEHEFRVQILLNKFVIEYFIKLKRNECSKRYGTFIGNIPIKENLKLSD